MEWREQSGAFAAAGFRRLIAMERVLFAPGIGIDIKDVAVLSKAIHESSDAGGAGKYNTPLLEGKVGGDDGRALLMAATDDLIEQIGGARITGQIPQLIQD